MIIAIQIRDLWQYYYEEKEGVIFVIDSGDQARFLEVKRCLKQLMQEPALRGTLVRGCEQARY